MNDKGPIIIDLGVDDSQLQALDDTVSGLRTVTSEWKDLNQILAQVAGTLNNIGNAGHKIGGSNPSGPLARLKSAQSNFDKAKAKGDPDALFDAKHRLDQAQRSFDKAQKAQGPRSQYQPLLDVLKTSRFNMGGGGAGVSPLVGRTAHALQQMGGKAGVAGAALAVVAVAAIAFKGALEVAVATLKDMATGHYASGGGRRAGQLAGVGAVLGMSATEISNLSRQFGDKVLNDPVAGMFARQAGINPRANSLWGDMDNSEQLLKAIDHIRKLPEREAIRFARNTDSEALLPLRDVSAETLNAAKAMFKEMGSPQFRRASAEYTAQLGLLHAEWRKFLTEVVAPMIPGVTAVVKAFRTLFPFMKHFIKSMFGLAHVLEIILAILKRLNMVKGNDDKLDRLSSNTEALDRNTKAIDNFSREIKGGGTRAKGAIPPAWGYYEIGNASRRQSIGLGAF